DTEQQRRWYAAKVALAGRRCADRLDEPTSINILGIICACIKELPPCHKSPSIWTMPRRHWLIRLHGPMAYQKAAGWRTLSASTLIRNGPRHVWNSPESSRISL